MDVQVHIAPASVNLGEPVTITYSTIGFASTILTIDNIPTPIDLGSGAASGSLKILPVIAGGFNVEIKGSGVEGGANDYLAEMTKLAFCQVH